MQYYDPDSISKERREEFLEWYELNKDNPFDFDPFDFDKRILCQ